jgi:ribosomal protein S18 acetylase RimI-like enzyme
MDIEIETATTKLLDELYEIEKQSFLREAFTKKQIAYLLTDYNAISLAARVNGEIVGFVIGRMDVARGTPFGRILTLETSLSHRRKGVAQKLLGELEVLFGEKGAVETRLEVREDNIAAISLYQKLGYKKVGKLERYYGDAHGLYFKKSLASPEDSRRCQCNRHIL